MIENIKLLSELYDTGDGDIKYTKSKENRSKAIVSQAVSALFVGSPGYLLYDEATRRKFEVAFMSKLARRSFFCYTPERIPELDFASEPDPITAMIEHAEYLEIQAAESREQMAGTVLRITDWGISTLGNPIGVTEEVFKLFHTYKRYNSEIADTHINQNTTYNLIRRHLQWKALKLAGAFAIFDQCDNIEAHHYIEAIQFCELLDTDMLHFEQELNKSDHEKFSDYIRSLVQIDGKAMVNIHDIKKQGFITNPNNAKLKDLCNLCAAYDPSGIYSIYGDSAGIQYETIIKTDSIGMSYKPIDITALDQAVANHDHEAISLAKHNIAKTVAYGFEYGEATFADLEDALSTSIAYTPFRLLNGVRGRENIVGGTKWVVMDVDDSPSTAEQMHFMLSEFNHYITYTSDPNNAYKFRVILELDSVVEVDAVTWKAFYLAVAEDLAFRVDPLPQSQIFYSYEGRTIYKNLEASPVPVRDYLMKAKEAITEKAAKTSLSSSQKSQQLQDPFNTFHYAYEAPNGKGSVSLIRAAYHAQLLGASLGDTLQLMHDINEYWTNPMPATRFENTILEQVHRIYKGHL
jgi:hypothetical protein